jgi:hypothetical protein
MARINFRFALTAFILLMIGSVTASAQATRTWVSGVGDDANPCSRTAPCKTWAGAISKTAVGGEIDALDPGGFGAVTITKSITLDGGGTFASILGAGTTGIIINLNNPADTAKTVKIRNLSINGVNGGTSPGFNGIRVQGEANLFVEGCTIFGFNSVGIDFEPSLGTQSQLWVTNTILTSNGTGGVLIKPAAGVAARATLDKVRMEKNQTAGLRAEDRAIVTVRDSVSASNSANGFLAFSAGQPVELNLESVVSTHNGTNGVKSEGAGAVVRLSNVTVVSNNTGLTTASGGTFLSFGNNKVAGNTPGGDGVTPPTTPVK